MAATVSANVPPFQPLSPGWPSGRGEGLAAPPCPAPAQWQAQRPTLLAAAPAQPLPPALLAELRAAGPRPPLAPDFYAENPLDRLALGLFRRGGAGPATSLVFVVPVPGL